MPSSVLRYHVQFSRYLQYISMVSSTTKTDSSGSSIHGKVVSQGSSQLKHVKTSQIAHFWHAWRDVTRKCDLAMYGGPPLNQLQKSVFVIGTLNYIKYYIAICNLKFDKVAQNGWQLWIQLSPISLKIMVAFLFRFFDPKFYNIVINAHWLTMNTTHSVVATINWRFSLSCWVSCRCSVALHMGAARRQRVSSVCEWRN